MCQCHNIVPRPQMHIAPQILAGLHGAGWHAGVLQETHDLVWGTLAGTRRYEGIQCVVREPALSRSRKARIIRQSCMTNEPGEGTPVRICRAAHDTPGIMPQTGIAALWDTVGLATEIGRAHV